jgi:hypothetical protein
VDIKEELIIKILQVQPNLENKIEELDNEIKKKKPSNKTKILKSDLNSVKMKNSTTYNIQTLREQIPVSSSCGKEDLLKTLEYGLKVQEELIRIEDELKNLK